MTFRHAAPRGAGAARIAARLLPAALLFPLASLTTVAQGQQPADILNKMKELYRGAKTYKGTITAVQSGTLAGGKSYKRTEILKTQHQNPNLFFVNGVVSGTAPGRKSGSAPEKLELVVTPIRLTQISVSDGKTLYLYSPQNKAYMKMAAPPQAPLPQILRLDFGDKAPQARMLPGTKVNGRDAFVLEITREFPPNFPEEQKKRIDPRFRAYIDKKNYQLLRIEQKGGVLNYSDQTFNAPIAASTFRWSPPAGSKEIKQPPQGAPGTPGAPAPGGGR